MNARGVVREVTLQGEQYFVVVQFAEPEKRAVAIAVTSADVRRFRVGDEVEVRLRKVPKPKAQA